MRLARKKNAVKIFLAVTIFAAFVLLISSQFIKRSNRVLIAKVNGQEIFKSEVQNRLNAISSRSNLRFSSVENLSKESLELLVKEIYLDKELVKLAKKSKAIKNDEVEEEIIEAQNRVLRHAYLNSVINNDITDQKINEKYSEISKAIEGKQEYLLEHILVSSKDEADKIYRELKERRNPPSFAEMAKRYSTDISSAKNGGNVGYILAGDFAKEFNEFIPDLKKDEVLRPLQTKAGWHIVKILDVCNVVVTPLGEVSDDIRRQLAYEKINQIDSEIVKGAKLQIVMLQKNTSEVDSSTPLIHEWADNRAHIYLPTTSHGKEHHARSAHGISMLQNDVAAKDVLKRIILEKSNAKMERDKQSEKKISE